MEKKNIAMQPKSKVLFLIDLCEDTINKLKHKNFNYLSFLNTIRGFSHVDVYEEISAPLLGKAIDYSVIVLVAHQENGIVKLKDGALSMHEMVRLIPKDTSSVIDIAICGSEMVEYEIISHCPNALPITSVETTQIEFRIPLYSQLLSFEYLGKSNYEALFKEIQKSMQAGLDLRADKLASFPSSTKLGTMSTSAVPLRVCRNSPFPVKVYIYADGDELDINAEIGDYRRNIKRNLKLNNGDSISWDLSFNTDPKPYENLNKHILGAGSHQETWNSEKPRIEYTFDCFVEPEFSLNGFNGVLKTTIGEKDPETWSFSFPVKVVPYKDSVCDNIEREQQSIEKNEDIINDEEDKILRNMVDEHCRAMTINDFPLHIEKNIATAQNIGKEKSWMEVSWMEVSRKIQEDFHNLKKKIEKKIEENKNTENYREVNIDEKKRLFLLDQRLLMMKYLSKIRERIGKVVAQDYNKLNIPPELEIREDIYKNSFLFFEIIDSTKVDIDVFKKCLEHIYVNESKGTPIKPIKPKTDDNKDDELRREYNGLAIMLAYPELELKYLYKFLLYQKGDYKKEGKDKIPKVGYDISKNVRNVHDTNLIYIEKLLKDKAVNTFLDQYLCSEQGQSSVLAFCLKELFIQKKEMS